MTFDIIGDIHGHCDKLLALLGKLGYRQRDGAWRHPSRQAIFVGDFIDRGPKQLDTLKTVRRMVDAGSAQALMGNHEFNAIAWYTEDPKNPGSFLRPRNDKNQQQHMAFLTALAKDPNEHNAAINWFYTLPLWLDLPGLRVVHACWHEGHMRHLAPRLRDGNRLTPELVVSASDRDNRDYAAVEALLKGLEVPLPEGRTFQDKDGHDRDAVRVRWWDADATTYRQAAITGGKDYDLPNDPIPESGRLGYLDSKPVFFGHYWMKGTPKTQSPTAACVDYSVAGGGPLVAYCWQGESVLDDSRFVSTSA